MMKKIISYFTIISLIFIDIASCMEKDDQPNETSSLKSGCVVLRRVRNNKKILVGTASPNRKCRVNRGDIVIGNFARVRIINCSPYTIADDIFYPYMIGQCANIWLSINSLQRINILQHVDSKVMDHFVKYVANSFERAYSPVSVSPVPDRKQEQLCELISVDVIRETISLDLERYQLGWTDVDEKYGSQGLARKPHSYVELQKDQDPLIVTESRASFVVNRRSFVHSPLGWDDFCGKNCKPSLFLFSILGLVILYTYVNFVP